MATVISEFQPNPTGGDPSNQTIELSGTPGESFSGELVSIESDDGDSLGTVDSAAAISGTFDTNGLLTVDLPDLENPSFTVALVSEFTGVVGTTDIDTNNDGTADDLSTLGTVFDAIAIPDATEDEALLFGLDLGGRDFNFTGDEPRLVFRDASVGDFFAINDPDSGAVFDINGNDVTPEIFDTDPTAGTDTFGAINPSAGDSTPDPEPGIDIAINEVDADTPGSDTAEFVELFDGGTGNTSLDGLAVVFYNGNGDSSDAAFDLDGFSTDSDGFFFLGNAAVANVDLTFSDGTLQNGADAVAIYQGDATDFPNGTSVTADGLLDAIVYDTNDGDDSELLTGLGQSTQFNEGASGNQAGESNSRVPDGTGTFVAQAPTPGATNESEPPTGEITPIFEIQGAALVSPVSGSSVTTTGIVTAVDSNGFYLQDPAGDGDVATADGIFVFTNSAPGVDVGDELEVAGTVSEFTPGGTDSGNLSTTQISSPTVTTLSSGNSLPSAVIIGNGGRVPPTESIDDDPASFNPDADGIDFFESLEGMLVTAHDTVTISGNTPFGEIFTAVDGGSGATGISDRTTLNISPDDFNPERVQIDEDTDILPGFDFPVVDTGDSLGDVTGVVTYSFGNFEINPTQPFSVTPANLAAETSSIQSGEDELTIASYNVLNLDPNDGDGDTDVADGRYDAIANDIINNLNTPDIIGLQEIQDNNGSVDDSLTAADANLQQLIDTITANGGADYEFIDNSFITDDLSGGQPGGNIRTAYLYNPDRVNLVDGSVATIGDQALGSPFNGSRLPLVADFEFNGQEVTVVNNHFSSKGGSSPILGVDQPFEELQEDPNVNGSLDERQAQAQAVDDFVDGALANNSDANIVVLGDLNEFEFISPVDEILGSSLNNLVDTLPADERYSFIFQGNSQELDHILVSDTLEDGAEFDIVHVNSEFAATDERASDHDPLLASLILESVEPPEPEVNEINGTRGDDNLRGTNGNDFIFSGVRPSQSVMGCKPAFN